MLQLHIKREPVEVLGDLSRMPPGCFLCEEFWSCPTVKGPVK